MCHGNFTGRDLALGYQVSSGRSRQTNKGFAAMHQQGEQTKGTQCSQRPVQASALTAILREP